MNTQTESIKADLADFLTEGGSILLKYFGKVRRIRQKEAPSSVVCEADLAVEKSLIRRIKSKYKGHSILSEESGHEDNGSEYTWVLDPLDGTSNFVAGLPWFGVMVGLLHGTEPVAAGMYLPIDNVLYLSTRSGGLWRNRERIHVTSETNPQKILCAFGFDPNSVAAQRRRSVEMLMRVAGAVRNTRATNSLVDFCYALEGRLGACINLKCMIWDIVPLTLMMPEAGGVLTDIEGKPLRFDLGPKACERQYTILGANKQLHAKLRKIISRSAPVGLQNGRSWRTR